MSESKAKSGAAPSRPADLRASKKEAKRLLKEVGRLFRRKQARLSEDQASRLKKSIDELAATVRDPGASARDVSLKAQDLDRLTDELLGFARKGSTREFFESIAFAVLIAVVLRAFVIEAFKIPSGSMIPTLEVGDHIFVNKFIYGLRVPFTNLWFSQWSSPERGDVIVFRYPKDQSKDYIKRVVAVAGDRIRVEDREVYVNDVKLEREHVERRSYVEDSEPGEDSGYHPTQEAFAFSEKSQSDNPTDYTVLYSVLDLDRSPFPNGRDLPGLECSYGQLGQPSECTVAPDYIFVMGDNRDNSSDSRAWGGVPIEYVKGKAMFVWWSRGAEAGIRWGRMGELIH